MKSTQNQNLPAQKRRGAFSEAFVVILQAIAIALLIRTFLYQPFNIPSGSMLRTLQIGDYVFVSKFSYGFSKYSIPFAPDLFSGRIWAGEPQRGDIAVFRPPWQVNEDYIKRVIGLPGDTIQLRDGVLYINGEAQKRESLGTEHVREYYAQNRRWVPRQVERFRETLSDSGVQYVVTYNAQGSAHTSREFVVPAGHYFMMGDNRDKSVDSRFEPAHLRNVPLENFVGRAEVVFFSITEGNHPWQLWKWPGEVRWSRIFQGL